MVVGVYGLGRFGSFWATQLAARQQVRAYSRRLHPAPDGVELVDETTLLQSDVLVVCVAISAFEQVIGNIARRIPAGTLVMDTCSIKVHPIEVMQRLLPKAVSILGTHPMFGPDSARDGIADRPMIITPVRLDAAPVDWWTDEFRAMGLRVLQMAAEDHDREAASTQGIAHLIGRVLSQLHLAQSPIGTIGYQKLVELVEQTCNDSQQLFIDLQRYNPFTADMRRRLEQALALVTSQLDQPLPTRVVAPPAPAADAI